MARHHCRILFATCCLLVAAQYAGAQSFPFQLRVQQGTSAATVSNGSVITMAAGGVGQSVSLNILITYRGSTEVLLSPPSLFGSTSFEIVEGPTFPLSLKPGQSASLTYRYTAATGDAAQAQLGITYYDAPSSGTTATTGAIALGFLGTAPEFVVAYYMQADGNVTSVPDGGKVVFPATLVNSKSFATVVVLNRGSGPGTLTSAAVSGSAFQALNLPLLPGTLSASSQVSFNILYSPKQTETSFGSLQLMFGEKAVTASLEGTATAPSLTYEVIRAGGTDVVQPNQLITLPETEVGEVTSVQLRVRNNGNAEGTVNVISVTGQGFSLSYVPFLPAVLQPNASLVFTLSFGPTQPGSAPGRLLIGNDAFELISNGLGQRLVYSYVTGSINTTMPSGGQIIFAPLQPGQTSDAEFIVENRGTRSAPITSISLSELRTSFTLKGIPDLPLTIDSGQSIRFQIQFAPTVPGTSTAVLRIDTASFTLSGSAQQPPPLPGYRFVGASGAQEPLQQIGIGLDLDSPYALPLTGTITLSVNSDTFATDPSVQFSTGGRTVSFTISANSTQAVFSNGATTIKLQTGSVASNMTITPSFALQTGYSLTPDSPGTLSLSVAPSAPRLISLQLGARSTNSFTLLVTGYATTRSLKQMDLQFTLAPNANVNLASTRVTISLDPTFDLWYKSGTSQLYGSLFTATVPFSALLSSSDISNPVDLIQSVSVTIKNDQGVSNSLSVDLRL